MDRAVDPWLSFGPDGTLHQITLAFDIDPPLGRTGGLGDNALLISKSLDGGVNWSGPITIIQDPNGVLNDKPSIVADSTDADFVYAVWNRFRAAKSVVVAPFNAKLLRPFGRGFHGEFYFARSTDGGDTWEIARSVYDPGGNNVTSGHQIVVSPNGELVAFFEEFLAYRNDNLDDQFNSNLSMLRSPDKGKTWLPEGRPVRITDIRTFGVITPDEGTPVFGGIFDVAVDASNGALYAVWGDIRFTGVNAIAFSMSTDGGFTWSDPIRINQTPSNGSALREQAFLPSVAVNSTGVVAVTYYDFRNDDSNGEFTDYFAIQCGQQCQDRTYWARNEIQLTDTSFDISQTPFASGTTTGFFVGDYEGLVAEPKNANTADFLAAFAMPHGDDRDSIFFGRFSPIEIE